MITPALHIGPARPARELARFGAIINLTTRSYTGRRVHVPIRNGIRVTTASQLIAAVTAVRRSVRAERVPVYLHCAAGRSRAPTVAALYLVRYEAVPTLSAAFARVKRLHRPTRPSQAMRRAARQVVKYWNARK